MSRFAKQLTCLAVMLVVLAVGTPLQARSIDRVELCEYDVYELIDKYNASAFVYHDDFLYLARPKFVGSDEEFDYYVSALDMYGSIAKMYIRNILFFVNKTGYVSMICADTSSDSDYDVLDVRDRIFYGFMNVCPKDRYYDILGSHDGNVLDGYSNFLVAYAMESTEEHTTKPAPKKAATGKNTAAATNKKVDYVPPDYSEILKYKPTSDWEIAEANYDSTREIIDFKIAAKQGENWTLHEGRVFLYDNRYQCIASYMVTDDKNVNKHKGGSYGPFVILPDSWAEENAKKVCEHVGVAYKRRDNDPVWEISFKNVANGNAWLIDTANLKYDEGENKATFYTKEGREVFTWTADFAKHRIGGFDPTLGRHGEGVFIWSGEKMSTDEAGLYEAVYKYCQEKYNFN